MTTYLFRNNDLRTSGDYLMLDVLAFETEENENDTFTQDVIDYYNEKYRTAIASTQALLEDVQSRLQTTQPIYAYWGTKTEEEIYTYYTYEDEPVTITKLKVPHQHVTLADWEGIGVLIASPTPLSDILDED